MNILRFIGQGARDLIILYRNHIGKENGGKELRQTNIRGYYGKRKGKLEGMGTVLRGGKSSKKKGKLNKVIATENVQGIKYTVFVEDGIIYWEFKKG